MQHDDNRELHKKFEKRQSFYRDMEKVSRKYLEFEQQVYYSPIKDINPDMILKLEPASRPQSNRREEIYIINGQYQPHGDRSFEKLILQLVQTIPRPKNAFGMIYINTLADRDAYNDFKKVLELLPVEYLFNLTKIYVLNASFFDKAFSWLSFGVTTNYIKNKTVNVETLRELSHKSHVEPEVLKKMLPKNVVAALMKEHSHEHRSHGGLCGQESEPNDKGTKKTPHNIATHFANSGNSHDNEFEQPKSRPPPLAFSQMRAPFQSKVIKQISDYQIGPTGAPTILEMLLYFFSSNEEYLKQQGLFRKSVSIDDQTQILQELNNKNYNYLETVTDPHLIANAIKRFLSGFRNPVIPFGVFQRFMSQDNEPNFSSIIVESIKALPKPNRMILFLLFDFLRNSVVPHAEHSKMGVKNLCIVFGPCLMRAEVSSFKDLIYATKTIVVTNIIYSEFEAIFGDKNAQARLKRNSYKEYRISENRQRESKSSKSSSNSKPQHEEEKLPKFLEPELRTPFFKDSLLHKTSQYIKEALEESQSEGEEDEKIEEEEPVQSMEDEKVSQKGQLPLQVGEGKPVFTNLFITPSVEISLAPQQQSLNRLCNSSKPVPKPNIPLHWP